MKDHVKVRLQRFKVGVVEVTDRIQPSIPLLGVAIVILAHHMLCQPVMIDECVLENMSEILNEGNHVIMQQERDLLCTSRGRAFSEHASHCQHR